jgi:AcrR family transcriptional regulator
MLDQTTVKGRLIAAAMRLAAEKPWHKVGLNDIADAAGVSLVDVRNELGSKGAVLAAFVRMVDDAVLARAPQRSGGQPKRDALFEVIMSRFDVLGAYKPALRSIASSWSAEPQAMCAVAQSQAWMLRAAGIRADGVEGRVRSTGLAALYASVYRTWLEDDDPGLAKTMAALDRGLKRGEHASNSFDSAVSRMCGVAKSVCDAVRPRKKPESGSDTQSAPEAPPAGSAGPAPAV